MTKSVALLVTAAMFAGPASPAFAAPKKNDDVQLVNCNESYGTIAVVDGDTQGWSEYGLSSPRALINSLAVESGCFTPHNAASGAPADFLMNVVAGDAEEVDQSIQVAKGAASEALLRSGAMGSVLSKVPMGGALLGAFGGFGGKKKVVAAGIKVLSPASGQTIVVGSGQVKKSTLTFGGAGAWAQGVQNAGYGTSKDGKMLAEAFIIAFNEVSAQGAVLNQAPKAAAPALTAVRTAIESTMRSGPSATASQVRSLRAGTELKPTGRRDGLFIEVEDNYGTKGWVSVEELG